MRKSQYHPSLKIPPIAEIFFSKNLFDIVNNGKAQQCGSSKQIIPNLRRIGGIRLRRTETKNYTNFMSGSALVSRHCAKKDQTINQRLDDANIQRRNRGGEGRDTEVRRYM